MSTYNTEARKAHKFFAKTCSISCNIITMVIFFMNESKLIKAATQYVYYFFMVQNFTYRTEITCKLLGCDLKLHWKIEPASWINCFIYNGSGMEWESKHPIIWEEFIIPSTYILLLSLWNMDMQCFPILSCCIQVNHIAFYRKYVNNNYNLDN